MPSFGTISAGFCAAQLALGDQPGERIIYTNVAPAPISSTHDRATRANDWSLPLEQAEVMIDLGTA